MVFFIGKLIKLIFKIVGILLLILILLPIIALIIMYKGYTPPVGDFEAHPTGLSFDQIASNKIDDFLDAADEDGQQDEATFDFVLTEAEMNVALKGLYAADNPNFGSSDTNLPELERKYAMAFGENGGFKGATATFYEGGFQVEAGVEAGFSGIYYQTTVFVDFEFAVTEGEYKLTLKDIKFGNLPILWMYDLASWGFSQFAGQDLNEMIAGFIPFGEFDGETKSVSVTGESLADLVADPNDPNSGLVKALLTFINDAELLESGFEDSNGGMSLRLGLMHSSKEQYVLTDSIGDDTELQSMLTGQMSSILISALLSGESTLNYDMHEVAFNQLLDYYIGNSMIMTQGFEFGGKTYQLQTNPLFAKFINNQLHLTIIMTLSGDAGTFKTDFTLVATPSVHTNGEDLVFTIGSVNLGDGLQLASNPEKVATILGLIPAGDGESYEVDADKLVLKGFLTDVQGQGVEVNDIKVLGQYLRFELTPTGDAADALSELQDAINDALDAVANLPGFEDIADALDEFINDGATDPSIILDAINDLTPEEQEQFFQDLVDALGDLEGLEDLIP